MRFSTITAFTTLAGLAVSSTFGKPDYFYLFGRIPGSHIGDTLIAPKYGALLANMGTTWDAFTPIFRINEGALEFLAPFTPQCYQPIWVKESGGALGTVGYDWDSIDRGSPGWHVDNASLKFNAHDPYYCMEPDGSFRIYVVIELNAPQFCATLHVSAILAHPPKHGRLSLEKPKDSASASEEGCSSEGSSGTTNC